VTKLSLCVSVSLWLVLPTQAAEPLPGTKPLTEEGELHQKMVDGIHRYLDRETAATPKLRNQQWSLGESAPAAYAAHLVKARERLAKVLGVVDHRVPPRVEFIATPGEPSLLAEIDGCKFHAVRWAVLPGIDAEGILIEPKGPPTGCVVAIPHADQTPEMIALTGPDPFARTLAKAGCRVLIPTLIDRNSTLSKSAKLGRATNLPHREFIHRMAYEMGRTLIGYEVQKILAAVDWFAAENKSKPIGVIGYGDGAMLAFYAAALDERISVCQPSAYFTKREGLAEEPIDRNVWGRLHDFGDAEIALLIDSHGVVKERGSRKLVLDPGPATKFDPKFWPAWVGPDTTKFHNAAPGKLTAPGDADVHGEAERWYKLVGIQHQWMTKIKSGTSLDTTAFLAALLGEKANIDRLDPPAAALPRKPDSAARQKRQFDQLVAFTQKLWRESDAVRKAYWAKADYKSLEAYEKSTEPYREYFHSEVIGKLPEPTMPLNPRTRQIYDEPKWTGYEVMLDVYPDVFASGILLLPKDLKPGEKRPVVVCQHGLEGTPRSTIEPEKQPVYAEFSKHLAEKGYIVYAPQNPYIGQTHFRQIQRKAQPLKLALFSFIIRQHQRTLDWLETLPNVDPKRIAFYGLSYGGKTAMRVPAIEKRYCLSICSADFNEWIGKNVSIDLPMSYMWTVEYDMYEFDLGNTFNYAEMAFLIAPRPFMVERGHDDGVGTDEMVSYEYAKVRYLYANRLKIPERTEIEYQPGGHRIYEKGTYAFLAKHLKWDR
jgi:dienelactone hydrolase